MQEKIKQIIKKFDELGNEIGTIINEYTLEELANKIIPQQLIDEARQNKKEPYIFEVTEIPLLPIEQWVLHPEGKYLVSNLGRVKFKDEIIPQKNKDGKPGWLILAKDKSSGEIVLNTSKFVYNFVSDTFLVKPLDTATHCHHITNNGYDNRPENLIWLTPEQHSAVHGFEIK